MFYILSCPSFYSFIPISFKFKNATAYSIFSILILLHVLLYRIRVDFILMLYPTSYLNLLISSNSFLYVLQEFLYTQSWQLRIKIVLFLIWRLFLSFSFLITLARTTMFNESGESKYPCPWGKSIQSFTIKYDLIHRFFLYAFYDFRRYPYISNLLRVLTEMDVICCHILCIY